VKKNVLIFFLQIAFSQTFAQFYEVGGGVGVLHYKGDVTPRFKPFSVQPGANAFFRYNLSRAVSLKASGMIGSFSGDDKQVDDPFQQARGYNFSASVMEGYSQIEYNFLNFRTNQSRITNIWTPYVFAGISYAIINTSSFFNITSQYYTSKKSIFAIPFGVGFKKRWNDNWNWGIEFGTRKTYTDFLDNLPAFTDPNDPANPQDLTNPVVFKNTKLLQGNLSQNDMYYYTSFSVSYVFYKISCPNPKR
jgi:hypothetical protein